MILIFQSKRKYTITTRLITTTSTSIETGSTNITSTRITNLSQILNQKQKKNLFKINF